MKSAQTRKNLYRWHTEEKLPLWKLDLSNAVSVARFQLVYANESTITNIKVYKITNI